MFNINTNSTKSVLLAVMLVMSVFAGAAGLAAAAAPTAGNTSGSTSADITDGGTQAYNDTTTSDLPWSADSANASIEITQDGETVYEASPTAYDSNDSDSDGTTDIWYYNVSLADDGSDYEGLEVGAGESVTLNVTLTNDTEAASPDTTNISYTFSNSEAQAFIASENPESEGSSGFFGTFSLSSLNFLSDDSDTSSTEEVGATLSTDSTTITENTSEVQLDTMSSNLTTAFSESTSEASSGDLIWSSYSQLSVGDDAQYVPVYYQSAGDQSWLNTTEDTYATISSDGETMTIHNPDALLDDGQTSATMDVTTVGDEALGWGNARSMLSADQYDTSATDIWTTTTGAIDLNGNADFVTEALA